MNLDSLLKFVLRQRFLIIAAFGLIAIWGAVSLTQIPIDAVPDITNKQVVVNTIAPALAPEEIEKRVSQQIETALAGIPGLESTRSLSRNGFSQVTAVFSEATDIYFARQQVNERLGQARERLPSGADPQMSAVTTGLGEVLAWAVEYSAERKVKDGSPGFQSDESYLTPEGERLRGETALLGYLRTIQDWVIAQQLRNVPGVAGIDSIGGYEKQYVVEPDPAQLAAYGVSFTDLVVALQAANIAVGADYVRRHGEILLVSADARVKGVDDIAASTVAVRNGVPILVRDVAAVRIGGDIRTGAGSLNGREAVIGTVQMLTGANSRTVAHDAAIKLRQVAKTLPPDVNVRIVYDRSGLVEGTIETVAKNLAEGALLVIAVLFLLLGNLRAAVITALVIPLAMLMAAIGMGRLGVSANLMSLGALDFGLIVDGAVIVVENCLRRLALRQHAEGRPLPLFERLDEVSKAAREMIRPTLYGQGVILLVYAPLLTFEGVEGKMFSPMAITVMLALAAALILSLTLVPALVAVLIRGRIREKDVPIIALAKRLYAPALSAALRGRVLVLGLAAVIVIVGAGVFASLGREFMPQLDEHDIALEIRRTPSMQLEQGVALQTEIERRLLTLPETELVFSKMGTGEASTDPMPPGSGDAFVMLKPRKDWSDPNLPKDELIKRIETLLAPLIGSGVEYTQPIEMRFNELIAGVRGDIAVKIYGEKLDALSRTAHEVERVLASVPGAAGPRVEQVAGFPTFSVEFDRLAIAQAGLTVEEVADTVAIALAGRPSGVVLQGDRQFSIAVRASDDVRASPDAIAALPIVLPEGPDGQRLTAPLRDFVKFRYADAVNQINRENGQRLVIVQANVRGRDLGSFVAEAQSRIEREVALSVGSRIEWGGQFETLRSAQARLSLVVPLCVALILGLLYGALNSWRSALLVFSAVPLALAGGVLALALRGMPFSISAAVGLIALSGVAVLNGLVLLTSIQGRLAAGASIDQAVREGALERLRPILMTALVASLGFVPMAIATGIGSEVQKPLATVVIGGLVTATVLTLFVLPILYRMFGRSTAALGQ